MNMFESKFEAVVTFTLFSVMAICGVALLVYNLMYNVFLTTGWRVAFAIFLVVVFAVYAYVTIEMVRTLKR